MLKVLLARIIVLAKQEEHSQSLPLSKILCTESMEEVALKCYALHLMKSDNSVLVHCIMSLFHALMPNRFASFLPFSKKIFDFFSELIYLVPFKT